MTKQEKIQEAWGINFPKNGVSENGWSIETHPKNNINLNKYDVMRSGESYVYVIRPKSLLGIENNNDWTRIQDEIDLPKTSGNYFVVTIQNEIETIFADGDISSMEHTSKSWLRNFTHYQPIIKPKPPIY